jgi:CsoR family transcriptional regulator, copper-sensing transcriptional repressor
LIVGAVGALGEAGINPMNEKTRTAVTRRLASAAGHLKGIERMVNDDAYCIDVIRQVQAVQAALNKVSAMILDDHLHSCVTTAIQGDNPAERERILREVASVFEVSNKL